MNPTRVTCMTLLALALAVPGFAKDSGSFVVRLGVDTTSVESYVRTDKQLEVNQVGRSPRALRRRFVYDLKNGTPTKFSMVVTPPGATEPTQTIEARTDGDSLRTETKSGATTQNSSVVFPKGTVVASNSSPWAAYEGQTMNLAKSKGDSLRAPLYFIGGNSIGWITVAHLGNDTTAIWNDRGDRFHAQVDKSGRILAIAPIAGTQKMTVHREASLDLDAFAASFAARDKAGAGLGVLSPRDTVRSSVAGASFTVDYSRPSKRGRVIFGEVVPFGQLWRTGANTATQFTTDKDLVIAGTTLPAGSYSLFTIPSPTGWKLIINSETGQPGTEHKADKDLFTFDMPVSPLTETSERFTISVVPAGDGGELRLEWDTTRASLAFAVKP